MFCQPVLNAAVSTLDVGSVLCFSNDDSASDVITDTCIGTLSNFLLPMIHPIFWRCSAQDAGYTEPLSAQQLLYPGEGATRKLLLTLLSMLPPDGVSFPSTWGMYSVRSYQYSCATSFYIFFRRCLLFQTRPKTEESSSTQCCCVDVQHAQATVLVR